jgi:membrane protein YdbS with pleckstrin-like domain
MSNAYTPLSSLKNENYRKSNRTVFIILLIAFLLIAIAWGLWTNNTASQTIIWIINGVAILLFVLIGFYLLFNMKKPNVNTIWKPMQAK